jgi:UDP-N-acetylglucosamine 2-epimerase (non-hydrolysing)/GDP/UDP-N,N'-diacetylbacillosamine 2-epimerase (hydrolysing)
MKCAVVTTSRADYGLLKWLVAELKTSLTLTCQLVVSGTHLQDAHGMTVREIEADGNAISARVLMDMGAGQDTQVAQSMAEGLSGFATAFEALQPDIVILLGDRYEVYAAMSTATVMRLPVAHLCGGDVTEGAYDEVFRHAISKAASLHFPSNPESAIRLQQLGEPAERIHMVGSTGLDGLHHMEWLDRDTLFERLNFTPQARNIVVTHHPVTREKGGAAGEITQVLAGLDSFGPDLGIIFTGVNADSEGDVIQSAIVKFCADRPNAQSYASLGQNLYLQTVRQADAVVGNSSSGLYEVPSLRVPTVNIGNRQAGRLQASSVFNTPADAGSIAETLACAFAADVSQVTNPYGDGHSSARIVRVLEAQTDARALLQKSFVDRDFTPDAMPTTGLEIFA